MMRFPVSFIASSLAIAAFACAAGARSQAPSSPAQSSSSQSSSGQASADQTATGTPYIVVDPLANVRYDNRYDVSLGLAYDHMKAGPSLLQGSNLGGLNLEASYWLLKHWGVEGTGRAYVGTSGAGVNPYNIQGPFVSQYFFAAGPEWLGPHNKHGALIAHAMFGGVYGRFQQDLLGYPPSAFDFYPNQIAPAAIIGGHMDLNRSAHWVFRITPDAVMTHYSTNYAPKVSQFDVNFAISVGVEYKFKKKR
ncbi:MAG: hypothetical protein ABSF53_19905 [Terracidiphilus sp.]